MDEKENIAEETEKNEKNEPEAKEEKTPKAEDMGFDDFLKNPKMQAEFDRRVAKALKTHDDKAKAKSAETAPETQSDEAKTNEENEEIAALKAQLAGLRLNAGIEDLAGEYGITHAQAPFIAKLVDINDVTGDDGSIDAEKLKAQLDGIAKTFPNLITTKKAEKEEAAPLKFGGDGGLSAAEKNEELNKEIANIFGIKGSNGKHFF